MDKITFKVAYLFTGTAPRKLELKKIDKNGNVEFINNVGAVIAREPKPEETVESLTLFTSENYTWQGEERKRVVGYFSYYLPDEAGHIEGSVDKATNKILYEAHRMLKSHQQVAIKDKNGNDINPNRYGATVKFELIEEGLLTKDKVEENGKMADALAEIKWIYEGDKNEFLDFCYAFGIRPVLNVPVEKLYNEAMLKAQINPQHFFDTRELAEKDIYVLIRKAMETPISEDGIGVPKTLISTEGDKYYIDGEIIGYSEQDVMYYLKTNLKQKEYIMNKLGITLATNFPVIELTDKEPTLNSRQKTDFEKKYHAERVTKMEQSINQSFAKYHKALSKNPEKKGDLVKDLDVELNKKREGYIDVLEAYDEKVAKEKGYMR